MFRRALIATAALAACNALAVACVHAAPPPKAALPLTTIAPLTSAPSLGALGSATVVTVGLGAGQQLPERGQAAFDVELPDAGVDVGRDAAEPEACAGLRGGVEQRVRALELLDRYDPQRPVRLRHRKRPHRRRPARSARTTGAP